MMKELLLKASENKTLEEFARKSRLIRPFKERFIGGETPEEVIPVVKRINSMGMGVILNSLGEVVVNAVDIEKARQDTLDLVDMIHKYQLSAGIAVKPTHHGLTENNYLTPFYEIDKIAEKCAEYNIFMRTDIEASKYHKATKKLNIGLHAKYGNRVGAAVQACIDESEKDERDIDIYNRLGISVRLCLGAYKEPKNIAFQNKKDVLANYCLLAKDLIDFGNLPAFATHNINLIQYIEDYDRKMNHIHEMLLGIIQALQQKIVARGEILNIYIPVGISWYPYIIRRLAENPYNLFFFLSNLAKT